MKKKNFITIRQGNEHKQEGMQWMNEEERQVQQSIYRQWIKFRRNDMSEEEQIDS